MLRRHVFVFEGVSLLEGGIHRFLKNGRHVRLCCPAGDFWKTPNLAIRIAQQLFRSGADSAQNRHNDAFLVLEERRQEMNRQQFRIAVLCRQFARLLYRFLRLQS